MEIHLPTVTVDDLCVFHAKHFPHAPTPKQFVSEAEPTNAELNEGLQNYDEEEDDGLGYYEDGVKRTLTDEQIALFRHTEIQTIIRERIRRREAGHSPEPRTKCESLENPHQVLRESELVATSSDKVQHGRVEKQTNWTKVCAKTKAKNMKNRKRWRAKQKEEKRKKRDEEEESDEWDPWHQATGPDAQKDEPIDLDY